MAALLDPPETTAQGGGVGPVSRGPSDRKLTPQVDKGTLDCWAGYQSSWLETTGSTAGALAALVLQMQVWGECVRVRVRGKCVCACALCVHTCVCGGSLCACAAVGGVCVRSVCVSVCVRSVCVSGVCSVQGHGRVEAGTSFICLFMHLLGVIGLSEVQGGPRLHIIPNA